MIATLGRTLKFAMAGVVGALVDVVVLLLVLTHLGPFGGRIVSFIAAATTTWAINRSVAFADRAAAGGPAREYLRYFAVMLIGGAVNFSVYAAVVAGFGASPPAPLIGAALGSLSGMGINLVLAHRLVFTQLRDRPGSGTRAP